MMERYKKKFKEDVYELVKLFKEMSIKFHARGFVSELLNSLDEALNHETVGVDEVNYGTIYWNNIKEELKRQLPRILK